MSYIMLTSSTVDSYFFVEKTGAAPMNDVLIINHISGPSSAYYGIGLIRNGDGYLPVYMATTLYAAYWYFPSSTLSGLIPGIRHVVYALGASFTTKLTNFYDLPLYENKIYHRVSNVQGGYDSNTVQIREFVNSIWPHKNF